MSTIATTKERPILFSGEMVRALLSGAKTQTRRIVKQSIVSNGYVRDGQLHCRSDYLPPDCSIMRVCKRDGTYALAGDEMLSECPYGQPGDRLWVRETFCIGYPSGEPGHWSIIRPTGSDPQKDGRPFYAASFTEETDEPQMCWKPSIHMPRWASRITLEITDVRVERLSAITEDDAKAEGVDPVGLHPPSKVLAFYQLWDRIHGPGATYLNPWLWVISFKRVAP